MDNLLYSEKYFFRFSQINKMKIANLPGWDHCGPKRLSDAAGDIQKC